MLASSEGKARGTLMWQLRKNIGSAVLRSNVNLLIDRLAFTGGDAAAAFSRQAKAQSNFFRGGDPSSATSAHWQHRNQRGAGWEAP